MNEVRKQQWAAEADEFFSPGWQSGGSPTNMRKVPERSSGPFRMAMAMFLSGLLVLMPACSTVDVAEEDAAGPVAAGSPSIADLVKRDIKRGDNVTVTEKNGTVHRLKVSKVDDMTCFGKNPDSHQIFMF